MSGALMAATLVSGPIILSVDDATPSGVGSGPSPGGSVTSDVATVSIVSGGKAPFTYAWAQGPGGAADDGPFTANSPSAAATDWTDGRLDSHVDNDEEWTCTVTDDDGKTAEITVTVSLTWTDTT